ncbi:MAG: serine/threonine protein kinase [Myxococcota bacterium]|jgi:serine/threonine protein kinase
MRLSSGDQIGAYTVEGLLGIGGVAEVWAVRHVLLGSRHALKLITDPSPELRRRIEREAIAMQRLDHPNLLPVEEVITVNGAPGLVMPLVEGPSLKALLARHQPSRPEALALLTGIAHGLAVAHRQGMVHRDLTPANILLDPDGGVVPRIMDFGLVKLDDTRLQTAAGMALGTPAYATPEQLEDARTADARADLWAAGVILCELLTGHRPYVGVGLAEVLLAHQSPPDLSGVPGDLLPLLRQLLTIERDQRMPSADALLSAIPEKDLDTSLAEGGPLSMVCQGLIQPLAQEPRSLWSWDDGSPTTDPLPAPRAAAGQPWTSRYLLNALLGQGGMASVWKAWDHRLSAWRAIKILPPELSTGTLRLRFEREAEAMAKLDHRSIVKIHDIGEHSGQLFIVMPWMQGGSLSQHLRAEGPLTPEHAARTLAEILDALQAAHDAGIVHRDVKPSNILLDSDSRPVLTDFGIAQLSSDRDRDHLTQTGMALGTLSYMAPEQRTDARSVDHRADIYAAGATLWTLLTAKDPLLFVAPEAEAELRAATPPHLADIILKATRYNPEERYPSAADMRDALRTTPPPPRRSRAPLLLALLALLATPLLINNLQPPTITAEPAPEVSVPPEPSALPAPEPEPSALPEPEPEPESESPPEREVVALPEPSALPEPEPEPVRVVEEVVEPARVILTGDSGRAELRSLSTNRMYAVGEVPPGEYVLEVYYASRLTGPRLALGYLGAGAVVTVQCSERHMICK